METLINTLIMSANDPKRTYTLQSIWLMKTLILIFVASFPFFAYPYDFHGNQISDSCEKAINDELSSGASQLNSYDNKLLGTIRHIFFVDYNSLEGVARYDCIDNKIIREDLVLYFDSREKALPHYNLLREKLSERFHNKVFDNNENKKSLFERLFSMILNEDKRHWVIWNEGKNKIDLVLFKYEYTWRLFLRTKTIGPHMERARELILLPGEDL